VTDRRSWHSVAAALDGRATLVSYDRRVSETPPSMEAFSHVDDLLAVLEQVTDVPAWLVGSSAGGGVALDAAISTFHSLSTAAGNWPSTYRTDGTEYSPGRRTCHRSRTRQPSPR
jgi:hypothetical protein